MSATNTANVEVLTCRCGASTTIPRTSVVDDQMRSTDWALYLHLEGKIVWICAACEQRVLSALAVVDEVFGPEASFVHLASRLGGGRG